MNFYELRLQVDPREAQLAKATRCQLSGQMLSPPVAADELGHLFNKDAVVAALLARTLPPDLAHIGRCVSNTGCHACYTPLPNTHRNFRNARRWHFRFCIQGFHQSYIGSESWSRTFHSYGRCARHAHRSCTDGFLSNCSCLQVL